MTYSKIIKKAIGLLFIIELIFFIFAVAEAEAIAPQVSITVKELPVKCELVHEVVLEETQEPIEEHEDDLISLGEFKLTAYCSCEKCCGKWAKNRPVDEDGNDIVYGSIGKRLSADYSIAVDPKVIPYGTIVIINGHEYEAMDCGGGIKENRIDVYFDDHQEARKFGVQYAEIFVKGGINR